MTSALRIQGIVFSVVAVLLVPLTIAMHRLDSRTELFILAVVIVLLGVPHGALDTVFVQRSYRIQNARSWAAFALLYFAPVVAVVIIWATAPLLFLLGFLLISIFHFSGDPELETPAIVRLLYGGAIIVLPTLFHGAEVGALFSLLVGPAAAATMMAILIPLGWPWLLCLVGACLLGWNRNRSGSGEIAAVTLVAVMAPPLPAFTIFFCGMHSARHILRTVRYFGLKHWRVLVIASGLPIIGIAIMFSAALLLPSGLSIDTRVIQILFVGLAALTVPHMAIIERVRFAGWRASPLTVSQR